MREGYEFLLLLIKRFVGGRRGAETKFFKPTKTPVIRRLKDHSVGTTKHTKHTKIKPKPQRGGRKQMAGSHDAAAEAQLSARVHHVGGEIVTRLQRWISSLRQKPRALPWAILWRPFRPAVGTIIPE